MNEPPSPSGTGLSGLAHADSADQIVDRYDNWAATYDEEIASWGYALPLQVAELLLARAPAGPILDAGCGTGLVGAALAATPRGRSFDIIGADVSSESLRTAARRNVYRRLDRVDLTAPLPYADASFGGLTCAGVLTYVPQPEPTLREFVRVLAPGAVAVVTQRTDLWVERDCDTVFAQLSADLGLATIIHPPRPYLPGLAEYGSKIEVICVEVTRPG